MENIVRKFNKLLIVICLILALCLFVACDPESPTVPGPDTGNGDGGDGGTTDTGYKVPDGEYTIEKEEGKNQLTIYWQGNADPATTDIWMWWEGKDGSGYNVHECGYGLKVVVNVPIEIDKVGFIVRTDCSDPGGSAWGTATKDYDQDRFAIITGEETFIWLKEGDGSQYTTKDNGETFEMIKLFTNAGMINLSQIQYNLTPACEIQSLSDVRLTCGNEVIEITAVSSLGNKVDNGIIQVAGQLDITKEYELEIGDFGKKMVMPTKVFDSQDFIENFTYDGDDLGATVKDGNTTFKVWAPTASKVVLNLFESGHEGTAYKSVDMTKADKGVWQTTETGSLYGKYYTYSVTTAVGTQEAVDPYAKSAGLNGNRGMIVDLEASDPVGFGNDQYVELEKYTDAVIWEVHVRDFSNKIASSQYKGKYMAFTETGLTNSSGISVGVDYVKNLGITHVHLLPVYDYKTVDEAHPDEKFNWGYDPQNYNVPEGSYSTNPYDGNTRVIEFKKMVQAMHGQGLGVIMDVVYNHTYDANSSLNKIVPYYYYRYNSNGTNSNGSGCGNETASDRKMYSKFMVDSVVYWMTEYHLDGFRFDLMGLHDVDTMQAIEQAVHAINPSAIIYGEGWTGGTSALAGSKQATQANIKKITASAGSAGAVAVFNDAIRDGVKGSVFNKTTPGYVSGAFTNDNFSKISFTMRGSKYAAQGVSWSVANAGVINYVSAHDNNTLWDKFELSNGKNTVEERLAMNRLAAVLYMVAPGTPFMQAGEEMLRTKGGDENSYASSDAVNNIDWEVLKPGSNEYNMMLFYKGLIALRKTSNVLTSNGSLSVNISQVGNAMQITFDNNMGSRVLVLVNPTASSVDFILNGTWHLYANGNGCSTTATANSLTGKYTVLSRDFAIFQNK